MRRPFLLVAAGALAGSTLVAIAGVADAQVLRGHNTRAPVDFSADRIEVQDRADRVVVSGNVQVTQAGMTMTAQRLTVAYHNTGGIEIDRLDASGGVVVTRGNERASGSVAIYDLNRRLITMIGNVQLNQGGNRLTGSRLVIDLASGRSTVDGSAAGGAPGTTQSGGRVSGTFQVRQSGDQ
ncbi:lipopolysaccharide export system protein LptA [Sphingobium sp. B1D7B]|uniref:LptA/OstA family protein n=1 Tax=unclassified Sphingobium TaxID=2611147 RepID=UPI00222453BB|nr:MULTISPECIES: LptA/OstA family protein [unclassified Sphingobium]MCW2349278.1 lipopolysaccharide export system protein LptA [Sphingobium sp. B12D2B]MCW2367546.1 lipopolysaccharide export system protein LptA [Sphingobium sp. B7D2B]MCW2368380.1 lipopolysaccharide export system protein LptA [Sphingobium sp. B11D3D]MCW2382903.1 lipopolysaccharide export system protein LptA [Sphingobium sp. B2D3B]MCW2390125.1 lipopolysaccharide export system protein LptA [Sphingobium sp. B11D3B]